MTKTVYNPDTDIEKTFANLADEWHSRTDYLSSPTRRVRDIAYLNIIKMGTRAIPYILRDLQNNGGDWYTALRVITGESPVPLDAQGDTERMNEAWFEWGRRQGYDF